MTYLNNGQLVELNGQPQSFFALAATAENLADKMQCHHADWSFDAVMTPDGMFCVVCTGVDANGDEALLGWL